MEGLGLPPGRGPGQAQFAGAAIGLNIFIVINLGTFAGSDLGGQEFGECLSKKPFICSLSNPSRPFPTPS
jgi:hypothetical protein